MSRTASPLPRRSLAGLAGLLLPAAAAVASPIAAAPPDAELIRLCGLFSALERDMQSDYDLPSASEPLRIAGKDAAVRKQQRALLDQIAVVPPTTMDGAAALTAALVLWEAGEVEVWQDDPAMNMNDRLQATLFRGLLGTRGAT